VVDPRTTRWLQYPAPRPDAALRLVCLPHAGGGSAVFRGWAAELPPQIELVAVRLPGRESRLSEPAFQDWAALLGQLHAELVHCIEPPYALFGHSFGAMLSYELAQLGGPDGVGPRRLVLAGCAPPGLPRPTPALAGLPAAELVSGLRRYGALPDEVVNSQSLLDLLLPMVRADLGLAESWSSRPARPVGVPLTVLSGLADPIAPAAQCQQWQQLALADFEHHPLPGNHFFLHEQRSAVLALLAAGLAEQGADRAG
jgi:medium-chain acyl-[acyl-carrier-protein] hydrolase